MWAQVLLLCAAGSLYPVAVVAVVAYLAGRRPLQRALAFLGGGALISVITGVTLIILIRAIGLTPRQHRTPSAWLEIALGIAVMVLAGYLLVRGHRHHRDAEEDDPDTEPVSAEPDSVSLWSAFFAGVAIYLPMLSYFAAVRIIANETSGVIDTAAVLVPCIIVSLAITEIPIVLVALARDRSGPILATLSRLVARYTRPVLLLTGAAVGAWLVAKGLEQL